MPSTFTCQNCGATNQPPAVYCSSCGSSLQAIQPTIYNSTTGRLLANVTLKQRYRIMALVGKGGMGAVYKTEDTQLGNRQVALKEMSQSGLSPQEQKEAADAFRQEALMLARLQHPNLPNIFDHFEENGRWYLVMSFIEGETLEDSLSRAQGGRLPLDEVLQIGMQLCTVLGYLHTQQPAIIFRDLKPANIMRTPDGHIYLIDFGIARHFKPGQAKDTAYYGSMGYAPPEQYGKAQTTPRSDIYSLGATLYQLVSGHDPSSSPFRFPLLSSLVPTVPANLATLLTRMLELDEDKRPASMLLVKQELQTLASPPTPKPSAPVPSPASVTPTQLAKPGLVLQLAKPSLVPSAVASPQAKGIAPHKKKRGISRRKLVIGLGCLGGLAGSAGVAWYIIFPRPIYVYTGHTAIVRDVAWSPDSKRIASTSDDGTVQIWDATTGEHVFVAHEGYYRLAWSPNGKYIVSELGSTATIWDISNGNILQKYDHGNSLVYAVAWSPDGTRIVSGGGDNTLHIWNATNGEHIATYHGHSKSQYAAIYEANWSPDGKYIASSDNFETVQIWNANTLETVFSYPGNGQVWAGIWSPDSKYIAFTDYPVNVVSTADWRTVYAYKGHATGLTYGHSITWSPDSKRIASADENTLHLWDATTGSNVSTYHGKFDYALKWSPDGQFVASIAGNTGGTRNFFTIFAGYPDQSVEVWRA